MVLLLDPIDHLDIWRANEPTDLPPPGRWKRRLREYPVNYGYFLRDPAARVSQAAVTTVFNTTPTARVTQSAISVVFSHSPSGQQLSGNPPRGPRRASDYTYIFANPLVLLGQDAVNPGARVYDLPPRGAPRAATLSDPGANAIPLLTLPPPSIPDGKTSFPADLSPRAPARARDYTYTAWTFRGLLGQDALVSGQQSFALPPIAPGRLRDYAWFVPFPVRTAVTPPSLPAGAQSFALAPLGKQRVRRDSGKVGVSLALLTAPGAGTESFQAMLII